MFLAQFVCTFKKRNGKGTIGFGTIYLLLVILTKILLATDASTAKHGNEIYAPVNVNPYSPHLKLMWR